MEKLMKKIDTMDPEERKRLQELLREKKPSSEKSGEQEPMDWMYKESKPDRDEYLLGRRVDKHIEDENKVEEDANLPGASFQELIQRRADIDMQTKMREDPLYAIKKREEDARRKLLSNPIKMKQLEKIIKEKEKSKKKKKKKRKHRSNSSSEEDSDDDLLNKYLEIRRQKEIKALKKSGIDPEDEFQRDKKKSKREKKHDRSRDSNSEERTSHRRRTSSSHSTEERKMEHRHSHSGKAYGLITRDGQPIKTRRRSRERSFSTDRSSKRRSRSRSPLKKDSRSTRDHRSSPKQNRRSPPRRESQNQKGTKKLSSEEMARRREEMMDNAKQRDRQREDNVRRYREESAREEHDHGKSGSAGTFLNPLLMKHAENTSVEDRIKRNIYNVQRTNRDLDKKFTKK